MWKYLNTVQRPENAKRKADENSQPTTTSKWKKYEERRPPRKFVESWKTGRPWLSFSQETGKMTCTVCLEFFGTGGSNHVNLKNVNTFVTGSSNLKVSTVVDHEKCSSHLKAAAVFKAKQSTPAEVATSQSGQALLCLNPYPNDEILGWSNLKDGADSKKDEIKGMISVQYSTENIETKGETAGYQQFLLLSQCFPKQFLLGSSKPGLVWERVKHAEKSRLKYLFKNAHAIAKQGRPISDYIWQCTLDKAKGLDIGNTYLNEKAAADFIFFIAGSARTKTVQMVKQSNFFSFIMDGSTDISGTEQESVYVRVSNKGHVEERFLHIGSPISTSSNDLYQFVSSLFEDIGIPKDKLIGMGSDGASNMTGCRSGLATLLRNDITDFVNVHCLCHRLELAFRDVVKKQKVYDKLMTLLIGLHYFYKKSHKNKCGLLNAFKALDIKGILPPKVTGTRWLPHINNGLEAYERSFAAFDAHLSTASHTNAKAEGLLKLLRDINVVTYALFLKEVIAPLMQLSKKLQKKDITLADSMVWIQTTSDMMEELKTRKLQKVDEVLESKVLSGVELKGNTPKMAYKEIQINDIIEAMHTRFQLDDTSSPIVKATKVLNFSKWPMMDNEKEKLEVYGNSEMQFLVEKYRHRLLVLDPSFNEDDVMSQWQRVKLLAKRLFTDNHRLSWQDVYDEECSNVFLIIDILLSLPPTSVSCETSFSQMKLVKTSRRVKLGQGTLNNLLQIKLVTPDIDSYDPEEAIDQWLTACNKPRGGRRFGYKRLCTTTTSTTIINVDEEDTVEEDNNTESDHQATTSNIMTNPDQAEDNSDDQDDVMDDNHYQPTYDSDSDYCSDFQDEEQNDERIFCYAKEYN